MEIIRTNWEERNLGLISFEVILAKGDTLQNFLEQEKILIEKGAKYIAVKAAVNDSDFLFELPANDYIFIEAGFSLLLKKNNYKYPLFIERFDGDITVKIALSHTDQNRIYCEIENNIFDSDRISLDPHFMTSIASTRYVNWIKDLVSQGCVLYQVFLKNDVIGFYVFKRIDNKKVQGVLTGTFKKYLNSGIGTVITKRLCDTVWGLNYDYLYASVVSNNIKALRTNLLFGYEIESISHHYVKHIV